MHRLAHTSVVIEHLVATSSSSLARSYHLSTVSSFTLSFNTFPTKLITLFPVIWALQSAALLMGGCHHFILPITRSHTHSLHYIENLCHPLPYRYANSYISISLAWFHKYQLSFCSLVFYTMHLASYLLCHCLQITFQWYLSALFKWQLPCDICHVQIPRWHMDMQPGWLNINVQIPQYIQPHAYTKCWRRSSCSELLHGTRLAMLID